MLRALLIFLGLPFCSGCGPSRAFVCRVDGVDVLDVQVPAQLGRLEVTRIEARLRSRSGRELLAGCEAAQ